MFLDEAGVDVAMSRSYGWAPPGETPRIERPVHGKRISLIGAIALDGARALRRVEGYVDGDEFVMDGPRIHRVGGVAEALAERGATAAQAACPSRAHP